MFTQSDREMLRACANRGGILPLYTVHENDSLKDQIKIYEKLIALIFNSDPSKNSDILIHENDSLKDQIKIYEKLIALIFNSDPAKASDILIHDGEVYRLDSYMIQGGDGETKTLTGDFTCIGGVK